MISNAQPVTHSPIQPSQTDSKYAVLGRPRRIWAISAIHAELPRLERLHDTLINDFQPGDRIVYCGNYIGFGRAARQSIDEILTFRRNIMAKTGVFAEDIVFLRGVQEEIWLKLLQLHYAPNPMETLIWMLGNGLAPTLEDYGFDAHDGIDACKKGAVELARWTSSIARSIRKQPGHHIFNMHLKRAAYTNTSAASRLLFIHAGINPSLTLDQQGENLWWSKHDFNAIDTAYRPFDKVIRGYDPKHKGMHMNYVTATIDGGCGFGGSLIATAFDPHGDVAAILEV